MTREFDVAIVGNGVAGFACASALARRGERPLLIGPGLPFDRPPLSKGALAAGEARPYSDAASLEESGISLLDGLVVDADLATHLLVVETREGITDLTAPIVVLAQGLSYEPIPIPGLDGAHVNATPNGLARLAPLLSEAPRCVVIVGAGLIGVETAATLSASGHEVTVLDIEPRPLNRLHDPLPAVAARILDSLGVRFAGNAEISGVEQMHATRAVVTTATHGEIEAEIVIAATGARLHRSPWLGPGPIEVDGSMRMPSLDGVFAIGDCSAPEHTRFGRLRLPHWDVAIGTAERAAAEIAGEHGSYDRVPYWWSDIGSLRIAEVGVAERVVEWTDDGTLFVGRDAEGRAVCCTVVGEPRRLREARELLVAAA